ncbi:hypothetical protein [Vibrio fortis]|uniref:hypothetical protein n=1 Tax=Vibrio fortis TaxID=212667 RepID=UPI0036F2FF96
MLLILDSSLFVDKNKKELRTLVDSCVIKRQAFLDFDFHYVESWIMEQETCEEWISAYEEYCSVAASYRLTNRVKVLEGVEKDDWELDIPQITLFTALHLVGKRMEIWLENRRNDGAFIKAVLTESTVRDLEVKRSIAQFDYVSFGGISELKMNLRDGMNDLGHRNKRFVICDSDAPKKNAPHREAIEVSSLCVDNKIPHHCLERRSIENYLPIDYLINNIDSRNIHGSHKVKTLEYINNKFTQEQRYHYHFKKGFKNPLNCKSGIYANCIKDPQFYSLIRSGFGDGYADSFTSCNEKERDQIRKMMHNEGSKEVTRLQRVLEDYIRLPI